MDDQGRYIKINKKMANINGYTIEEHLGRTIEELLPQLSPVLMPVYKDIIENGKTYSNMEISSETHGESGKKKTWIGSSFPLPGPGPKRNYVGAIVVDITAQKEFEAALKTERDQVKLYMDVASAVFLILDKESRIMLINKKGYEVLGYDEGSLIGKKWFETCVPADKGGKSRSVFDGVISGKVPPVEYAENEVLTKSGAKRTVAFHSAFIRDENNEIIAVLFSGNDITDKKIAEESLRKLNEELETRVKERTTQLESVNVELEAFAYSVSHDLRAPLRAIDGFSKILLEDHSDKLDSEAKRLLDIVRNNTKNMGQLIDGLMAFARLGKEELRIVELNMEEMAISVFEEISAQYRQRNIDFAIKRLHPVMGDSAMMRQVLYNLINNSAKYTRNNPTAFIEVGSVHEGNKITYYVKDNGVGFNPEYAYKLFGVFERLHSNSEFEGTGVGLAIVERIIKRHGGSVRAEGKVNEGAVFYFSLPVKNII
jgi:PAS domain S-box-containing protein